MGNQMLERKSKNQLKEAELVEIPTKIGVFLCATWNNYIVLFEFKHRKTIDAIFQKKSKYFHFVRTDHMNSLHRRSEMQIKEYLDGKREIFDLPIYMTGTDFQKRVWNKLLEIPYGETITYGQLASSLNNPKAMRAVGGANGANSIAIIVPCHRVINSQGNLHGYGGGIDKKEKLLQIETTVKNHGFTSELEKWFD